MIVASLEDTKPGLCVDSQVLVAACISEQLTKILCYQMVTLKKMARHLVRLSKNFSSHLSLLAHIYLL